MSKLDLQHEIASAWFSLSSAIKTASMATSNEEKTTITMDSDVIIEICELTAAVIVTLIVMVILYKSRNRINRFIRRAFPKDKFPHPTNQVPTAFGALDVERFNDMMQAYATGSTLNRNSQAPNNAFDGINAEMQQRIKSSLIQQPSSVTLHN